MQPNKGYRLPPVKITEDEKHKLQVKIIKEKETLTSWTLKQIKEYIKDLHA